VQVVRLVQVCLKVSTVGSIRLVPERHFSHESVVQTAATDACRSTTHFYYPAATSMGQARG
jgi:hypothetical protein